MNYSDLIIIGAGPGGYRAAAYASEKGLSVTVIEASEVGGTCLNCGCIPTKSLCHDAETGKRNFADIMTRKDEVVASLRSGVETILSAPGISLVRGRARFVNDNCVCVGEECFSAKDIIIATGSRAKMPPIKGIDSPRIVTSTEMLALKELPARLCIIGAGVIGLEFASCFSAFGSEVTVIEFMKECLPTMDSEIAKRLRKSLEKRGITFHMQSGVESIEERECAVVNFTKKGKAMQVEADLILVATGRLANTDGLNLEATSINVGRGGITVDPDTFEAAPHIYAIGDVNGRQMLAHAATYQGLRAVNHILGKKDNIRLDIMPAAVFSQPEAASVGFTEEQLKAEVQEDSGEKQYSCHKALFRANGKALATEASEGIVKIITASDGRIIGAHILGSHAADMIQEIAALMNCDVTLSQLRDIVHIHPTLAEMLTEVS
ncbi:MAG: dihydrolipoyl dehydrogenase [Bacteroidaceae bacterium]|nr:dihydrolipoyl dehydrogenase [Bacteroidaceae bacterium]